MSAAAAAVAVAVPGLNKVVVGMADMQTSCGCGDELITYALGSCLGITVWDPVCLVGAMLHVMMPTGKLDPAKARARPFMFVDAGVPLLFRAAYKLGAKKERLIVSVAGGAAIGRGSDDRFKIGKRNFAALRKLLWKNGVLLKSHDVGGNHPRTMSLAIASGEVQLRTAGDVRRI